MKYEKPEIEVMNFKFDDVITGSPGSGPVIENPDTDEEISGGGWG